MQGPTPTQPRFVPVADHAVLVEFAETISDEAHAAVLAMDAAIAAAAPPGFREAVPAYVNILVEFDPIVTDHAQITERLRRLVGSGAPVARIPQNHVVDICYEPPFSPDLDEVCQRTGLTRESVIAAHLAGDYKVYLYGFAPGYAYLGGLPQELRLDRKPAPKPGVPAGSVIIAGAQALVTTLTMPTGWWIIGRSPTAILTGNADAPFLFQVGDKVRFRRIGSEQMTRDAVHG